MARAHRTRLRQAGRVAVRAGAAGLAAQVGLAAALTGVDAVRKRRPAEAPGADHPAPPITRVEHTEVTTYTFGEHLYEAMLADIAAARDHVYLCSYIWKSDEVGQRFKDALTEAARRGVLVCLVFDGFANLVVPRWFKRFPPELHLLKFPVVRPGIAVANLRRAGRDHRKMLVVDGQVGYAGGYNIGSLYARKWRDTHVRLEGPSVWELENAFVDFWNRHRRPAQPVLPDTGSSLWDPAIRVARNEPSRLLFPVRWLYLDAIDRAVERIWITQGYFIPDRDILEALLAAAARGVDVRVIMPAASNHVVADWVARSYFSTLLRGGVRIHLFEGAMVHAKTATVDGRWTTVGSANIDRLSLVGNYEVNLEIHDAGQAARMEEVFRQDLRSCRELTLGEWEARGLAARVTERVLSPLGPLL